MTAPRLFLVANARMPSQRAQSLQVAQVAGAFERAGARTTLLHARRTHTPALPAGQDLFDYYGVPPGPRPSVESLACVDFIDRVPRALQFLPARVQELSFGRRAAARIRREPPGALVLSREVETARALVRSSHRGRVFLELHRLPGGDRRRAWLRTVIERGAGLIAISGGVRDDLVAFGAAPGDVVVEHDGFESARFEQRPGRAAARRVLGLDEERPLVVYTGGLLAWKGVDLLVEAARELGEVQVVIAGGMDADVERLRARCGDLANVRLDGFQPPERVATYLAAADLLVVPNRSSPEISARYTSPLKVFEAMAVGLPMVVSDLPSLRDVLGEDEARFVAPDDAQALARGIAELLADSAGREAMAERLRERAPKHTWDARATRLLAWMQGRAA